MGCILIDCAKEHVNAAVPDPIEALHAEAVRLQGNGQLPDAVALYRTCIEKRPDFTPALYNLGMILLQHGQYEAAIPLFSEAYKICPNDYNFLLGYGIALRQAGHTAAAIQVFCAADRLAPDQPHPMCNLAATFNTMGEMRLGDCFLAEATRRAPDFPNVRWLNAMRLLRQKRYREGWPLFESRFDLVGQAAQTTRTALPRWKGEARPMALLREQGHGDCLMMARFIRHHRLLPYLQGVEVTPPLVKLFQYNFPEIPIVDDVANLQGIEAVLPLMSLPGLLDIDYAGIASEAYLAAPGAARDDWAGRLPERKRRMRVAVYWRGSPLHANDANRSMPFAGICTLFEGADSQFISIQHEARPEELDWLREQGIHHVGDEVRDFTDLAGILANVDLLIGVDSAPIHLAGALGVPVWLLLPTSPDWRWGEKASRTKWYRRMCLIRQKGLRDWEAPLSVVHRGLHRLERRHGG